MSRLYSDIKDSSGRRFYYDLASAPGGVSPATAVLTIGSLEVVYPLVAFREPGIATLNITTGTVGPEFKISPSTAGLSPNNAAVGLQTILQITPSLASPVESPENDFVPTILFISTISPDTAVLSLATTNHSLTQGGNIGFLSPTTAALTFSQLAPVRVLPVDLGLISISGNAPDMITELVIAPEAGLIYLANSDITLVRAFTWVDDDPSPLLAWG